MAKLSDLIDCLTVSLGLPRTTVEAYAKPLRKAGLIASSGRSGPGAPDMTADDAANLLIAILAGSPTQAVARVETYANLMWSLQQTDRDAPLHQLFRKTFNIDKRHSFRDFLAQAIYEQGRYEALFVFTTSMAALCARDSGLDIPDNFSEDVAVELYKKYQPIVKIEVDTNVPLVTVSFEVHSKEERERIFRVAAVYEETKREEPLRLGRLTALATGAKESIGTKASLHGDFISRNITSSYTLMRLADVLFPCPMIKAAWDTYDHKA